MLKLTKVEIELICDAEMSDLLRRNIRGGLSFINTRSVGKGSLHDQWESDMFHQVMLYLDANVSGKKKEQTTHKFNYNNIVLFFCD